MFNIKNLTKNYSSSSLSEEAILIGGYYMNLIHLGSKEQAEINKYIASCSKRKLGKILMILIIVKYFQI